MKALLGWLAASWLATCGVTAQAADASCRHLAGDYDYTGRPASGSAGYAFGREPNIAMILFPDNELANDTRVDHYRITFGQGHIYVELRGRAGLLWRLNLANTEDFSYCQDGVLVVERQRQNLAGSVQGYSRYRHTLRQDARGDLLVQTDISGKYRTWLFAWERPPEHQEARFVRRPAQPFAASSLSR